MNSKYFKNVDIADKTQEEQLALYDQVLIQSVLAMSEEELSELKEQYCIYLAEELKKEKVGHYKYNDMSYTISMYSSMSLEEFRQSMLFSRTFEENVASLGPGKPRMMPINIRTYIHLGAPLIPDLVRDFSRDSVEHPESYVSEQELEIIKEDAKLRAEDIKEKLKVGMSLYDAVNTEIGYRDTQGKSK